MKKKTIAFVLATFIGASAVLTGIPNNVFAQNNPDMNADTIQNEEIQNNLNDTVIDIPDPNLKTALNEHLGQQATDDITKVQLEGISGDLDLSFKNIANI